MNQFQNVFIMVVHYSIKAYAKMLIISFTIECNLIDSKNCSISIQLVYVIEQFSCKLFG